MEAKTKASISFVSLFIGVFLVFEGSKITSSGRPELVDIVLMAVGAVLVLAYPLLIGNYLEVKLKTSRTVSFMPMLLVVGVLLVYQGVARPLGIFDKLLLAIIGLVLVVASALMIFRIKKR